MKNPIRLAIFLLALTVAGIATYLWIEPNQQKPALANLYDAPPEGALKVLFIGNSHTFVHQVHTQLQYLGEAADIPIWVEGQLVGGATLNEHRQRGEATRRIREGKWDFVVIQEQSTLPAEDPNGYLGEVDRLADLIKKQGATPVIYATWPRAHWDDFYSIHPNIKTPKALNDGLNATFHRASQIPGVELAPVGTAWALAARDRPDLSLYAPDGNHAGAAGAYLAASVFFHVLTDQNVTGNTFTYPGLSAEDARALQQAADESPAYWSAHVASPSAPPRSRRFQQQSGDGQDPAPSAAADEERPSAP